MSQSNQLVEARYSLTGREQKIILSVISQLHPDDCDFRTYRLSISSLSRLWGISQGQFLNDMEKMLDRLMSRVLRIPEGKGFLRTHWLSSARHEPGWGYIEVKFDPDLKPYLLQLRNRFTSFRLGEVSGLRSGYSLRLYQLLVQYEGLRERTLILVNLREMLGIEQDQYRKYTDFRKRVLVPAHEEINDQTRIRFDFHEIKEGRTVNSLRFTIGHKPGRMPKMEVPPLEPPKIKQKGRFETEIQKMKDLLKGKSS